MNDTVKKFKEYENKMQAYSHAMGVMSYDSETVMPRMGVDGLTRTMGVLSEESYKLGVSDELRELITALDNIKDELDPVTKREVEVQKRELDKLARVPMAEYVEGSMAITEASNHWREAKVNNDFAAFRPYLEKVVAYLRLYAGYVHPELPGYDAMLDEYERGLRMTTLDVFFADVREKLVPVVKAVTGSPNQPDMTPFHASFPITDQRRLTDYLASVLTIDRSCCTIGEVEHPFTSGFSKHDVRFTTHYYENDFLSNMFSVIHEGGHSLYELHTADELIESPLGCGANSSMHESQSRLFENIIGRSRAFTDLVYPELSRLFPSQFEGITREMLYRAVNRSTPSLIRTEADELTYPMHIMIRYELEKKLMDGSLVVADLPEAWNAMYKEYLGVTVPDDRSGVLQDMHWAGGMIGYFPSYALGSAYASQIFASMEKDVDVRSTVSRGDLSPVVGWLTEHIFKYGMMKESDELIALSCKAEFDPSFYTDYLTRKYKELYRV